MVGRGSSVGVIVGTESVVVSDASVQLRQAGVGVTPTAVAVEVAAGY